MRAPFLAVLWFSGLFVAAAIGCAPAWKSYSGCHVDCRYCPPPPLPYLHYAGCQCHACAVAPYLRMAGEDLRMTGDELPAPTARDAPDTTGRSEESGTPEPVQTPESGG